MVGLVPTDAGGIDPDVATISGLPMH